MGIGTWLGRVGLGVMLRHWWARHAGVRAFAYAVMYSTFLVPAYLMPYLLVVELHGIVPGAALVAWDPMFLLLPVCLLAPYALTRAFVRETRWPARLSAVATILGLGAILDMALAAKMCQKMTEDSLVAGSLLTNLVCPMQFWGGVLAVAAVLHVAVIMWGVRAVSSAVPVKEEKGAEREAPSADNVGGPKPDDGGGDGGGAKADSTPFWRKSADWARRTARQGAAKAGSGAGALWRKTGRARAAAATAAHTGKRRLASAWRGLRDGLSGVAEKRGGGPDGGGAGA